jgi:hypothetical protein
MGGGGERERKRNIRGEGDGGPTQRGVITTQSQRGVMAMEENTIPPQPPLPPAFPAFHSTPTSNTIHRFSTPDTPIHDVACCILRPVLLENSYLKEKIQNRFSLAKKINETPPIGRI